MRRSRRRILTLCRYFAGGLLLGMVAHHAPRQMAETPDVSLRSVGPCVAMVSAILMGGVDG